jgi:hypothetical protein
MPQTVEVDSQHALQLTFPRSGARHGQPDRLFENQPTNHRVATRLPTAFGQNSATYGRIRRGNVQEDTSELNFPASRLQNV